MLVPIAAASIALTAALAGYVMVKFYGVVFLGQPREAKLAEAHDAGPWERVALLLLAVACVVLGLVPAMVIGMLDPTTKALTGHGMAALAGGWLYLAPIEPQRASYSPVLFFLLITLLVTLAWFTVRAFYHGRVRRTGPWDCGFAPLDARMQDTAEGFGQPVRQIFEPFFHIEHSAPTPFDLRPRYRELVEDRLWRWLYLPLARGVDRLTSLVTVLQRGRISVYLMYSFATLLLLLFLVQ
jgi:hypothetical protein